MGTWAMVLGLRFNEHCILAKTFAGNLHLNIVAASYSPEIQAALEPFVYELVGESENYA